MWPDVETSWGTMIVRNVPKEVSFGIEDFRRLSWAGHNNPLPPIDLGTSPAKASRYAVPMPWSTDPLIDVYLALKSP